MNPLVSILIPVYNRVSLVGETIESAINQTYQNIEIVIVDNCSTDGTWQLLEKYALRDSRIKIFRNEENIGPVRNWKRCIEESKGDFSKILFSDDLISSNFIEETLNLIKQNPEVSFVFTKTFLTNIDNNVIVNYNSFNSSRVYINKNKYIYYKILGFLGLPNSPGCALFRTSDLSKSLYIDIPNKFELDFPKFGAGNDLLLFLETIVNYKYAIYTDFAYSVFRGHKDSFSTANKLKIYYDISKKYFLKKHGFYFLNFILFLYLKVKINLK